MNISYFFWLGTIYLLFLTFQDYKDGMLVDDRRNYFMMGLAVSIYTHIYSPVWYKLVLGVFIAIIYAFMRKIKAIGEADVSSLTWIFTGLGLIDAGYIVVFFLYFAASTTIFLVLKNYLFKYKGEIQFYGVLLTSFVAASITLKGY